MISKTVYTLEDNDPPWKLRLDNVLEAVKFIFTFCPHLSHGVDGHPFQRVFGQGSLFTAKDVADLRDWVDLVCHTGKQLLKMPEYSISFSGRLGVEQLRCELNDFYIWFVDKRLASEYRVAI